MIYQMVSLVLDVVAGLLAGCGGGSSTLPPASTTAAGATGDTMGGGATDGTTVFSGNGDSDYCQLVREYDQQTTAFDDLFSGDTTDPAEMAAAFAQLQQVVDQLVSIAPAEVKADAQVMGDATKQMIALIAKNDYDFTKLMSSADATALNDLFNSQEIAAASDHLDQYDQQVCGITAGS